jgi:hypothetical protein
MPVAQFPLVWIGWTLSVMWTAMALYDSALMSQFIEWSWLPHLVLFVLTRRWMRWKAPRLVRAIYIGAAIAWAAAYSVVAYAIIQELKDLFVEDDFDSTVWILWSVFSQLITSTVMLFVVVLRRFWSRGGSAIPDADSPQLVLAGCPTHSAPGHPKGLTFSREPMVRWFDPRQLAGTAIRAILGGIFGEYADKREVQAAGRQPLPHRYPEPGSSRALNEIWIDYVADVGDGWDSTYSVATLIARPSLLVKWQGTEIKMHRGRILILGGDQVYPTPTREEYQNRFLGPYSAALPCVREGDNPDVFAIPGNHDWYDGLTSFARLFHQGNPIGGWQTKQARSYFAISLPHRWWLWGVDLQLSSDFDWPQLEYFRDRAKELVKGDRIILCSPEPCWVYHETKGRKGRSAYDNLEELERSVIRPTGARVVLNLTGDLHHYCRYQYEERHKITAGGGGAYLYPTHRMPKKLHLPTDDNKTETYRRKFTYPSSFHSWRLAFCFMRFPFKNPRFVLVVGGLYLLSALLLQSASLTADTNLLGTLSNLEFDLKYPLPALSAFVPALARSPATVVLALVLVGALIAFAELDAKVPRWRAQAKRVIAGSVHALMHLGLIVVVTWFFANYSGGYWDSFLEEAPAFCAQVVFLGGIVGVVTVGLYLFFSHLAGLHDNELFSSQGIADYKNFLRLHIQQNGSLTLYPIKVQRVCRAWRIEAAPRADTPSFTPLDSLECELIEEPIGPL